MYSEKVKFRFNDDVSHADRVTYLAELFGLLEAQSASFEQISSGGLYNYQIKYNGKVSLSSYFPGSTSIISKFIRAKRLENIVE